MSYYVCIQWPSDKERRYRGSGHENAVEVYVAAGPYSTQTEAYDVSTRVQKAKDLRWHNPDVGTDQGKYFVLTENDLLRIQNGGDILRVHNSIDAEHEPLVLPSFMKEYNGSRKVR